MKVSIALPLLSVAVLGFSSCKKQKIENLMTDVVANHVEIVEAAYQDSYDRAVELKTAIYSLVDNPTQSNFDAAKAAWLAAREPYGQTEAFRFSDGPIDDADGPEGAINAWPLDENYIDYVRDGAGGTAYSGIIYDTTNFPVINAATLAAANELGGEKNISLGFHAIEFLLWGQDYLDVNMSAGQGGARSYTDYTAAEPMYIRRGQFLKVCADQLVGDLESVLNEWKSGGSYRASFLALDSEAALAKILTGAGILSKSELAGERMFVALEANPADNPQEDEHSCFSDNTHRDIYNNAKGIYNILSGTYTLSTGVVSTTVGDADKSVLALLELEDEDLAAALQSQMTEVMTKIAAIPTPFDKAVTEENVSDNGPILQAITALRTQGDKIAEAATALGFSISTELPE